MDVFAQSGFSTWFQAQGWVHDNDSDAILSNYDVTERYLTALYWAFQTVTTVGYGDVGARTQVGEGGRRGGSNGGLGGRGGSTAQGARALVGVSRRLAMRGFDPLSDVAFWI